MYGSLINERIDVFRRAFVQSAHALFVDPASGRSRHPGEQGTYREAITKDFLRDLIPRRLGIGSGFVVCPNGEVSTQCDIIIYDLEAPVFESIERQRFYPVESVCGIGEVKSDVGSMPALNGVLTKLAAIKKLRRSLVSPVVRHRDKSLDGRPYDPCSTSMTTCSVS